MNEFNLNDISISQALDLYKQGKLDAAQQLFLNVLKNDPKNPDAIYFMAMIDHQAGRTEVAEHRANELLQLKPEDGKALNLTGTLLMSQGKTQQALPYFDKGIKYNKTDPLLRVNAAICNIGEGNPAASIERCKEAIELNTEYPNAYNILGNAYMGMSDMEKAAQSFEKALALEPDFLDARFNLGAALLDMNRYDEAQQCFDAVLENNPDNVHALTRKADVLLVKDELSEAGPLYEKALKNNQNFTPAYIGMGKLFQRIKKDNEALSHFKRAIELNPNNIEAITHAGDSFRNLGQYDAATAAFQDVLSIDPDNAQAKFHLAALQDTPPPAKPGADYVRRLFDEFVPTYDESLARIEYNGPEQLVALARQFLPDGSENALDILDIGCGTGLSGIQFRPLARKLKGIDIAPRMIEAAKKRGIYDELEVNEILTALVRHQDDTDMVVSADAFPYFGDLDSAFLAVVSALHNQGLFLFTVETHDKEADYLLGTTARYSHSRNYISNLAKRRGLEVLACNATVYRKQSGKDVQGMVVALKKNQV